MVDTKSNKNSKVESSSTRRDLLRKMAFLGTSGLLAGLGGGVFTRMTQAQQMADLDQGQHEYHHNDPENIIYSACLQCHTACTIKCKVIDGVLVKIDGNPWSPQTNIPNVPYLSSLEEGARIEGKICPKGQSGIETQYDPHRIRTVLKRKPGTPRGGGEWETIDFNTAVDEIVNGGDLFGEGHVDGLNDIYALRDRDVAAALGADTKKVQSGEMTIAEFKRIHAANLDKLIDPDHPDLGPKNNQFVFLAGRIEHGRKELMKWWTNESFGSVNTYEHTTICEQSHHIGFEQVTNQWKDGKWQGGKHHLKPDIAEAEFVIFFGTGFTEANFGPPLLAGLTANAIVNNGLKFAVVDPRLSRSAGKADWWIPIKPGADGAFAMGMIKWIIDNNKYDAIHLENANKAAASADGEKGWTTSTFLVKMEGSRPTKYLRADEVGLGTDQEFVVSKDGQLVAVNINDSDNPIEGDLDATYRGEGIQATTSWNLLSARVSEMSLEQYAEISGLDISVIVDMASEFTSHGKKSIAEFYRGPVQHTNGYYNAQALIILNMLIGNVGWKGGWSVGGSHWHEYGGKDGNVYNFSSLHPDKFPKFGHKSNREKSKYEDFTGFSGYPALRPWYPFTSNLYQEVIPSAEDGYPYPIKAMYIHKGTPALACPAGHKQIKTLRDPSKIPLLICCDIVIGETTMFADYVIPDTAVWERWGTPHISPAMLVKVSKVRQPAVAPLVEKVTVDGVEMPINMEAFLIAAGKKLGLPGIGSNAFGPGKGFDHQDDWFMKLVANMATGDKVDEFVPAASEEEFRIYRAARAHLPAHVHDEERLKKAAGEELWPYVVYVLNRGGRFEDTHNMWEGNHQKHPFKGSFQLFVENVAGQKNSMSGQYFDGLPRVEGVTNADGSPVSSDAAYPFKLITYKEIFGGHSRTMPANLWQREHIMENHVLMNTIDAEQQGLSDGDVVRMSSPTNPDGSYTIIEGETRYVEGKIQVMEGMRPGVVAISWHFGHWAYGSRDMDINGDTVPGDPKRSTGMAPNPLMLEDAVVPNVCLTDPIGGSSSFFDTPVKVVKV